MMPLHTSIRAQACQARTAFTCCVCYPAPTPKTSPSAAPRIQCGLKVGDGGVDRLPGELKHPKVNAQALLAVEVQVRLHRLAGV